MKLNTFEDGPHPELLVLLIHEVIEFDGRPLILENVVELGVLEQHLLFPFGELLDYVATVRTLFVQVLYPRLARGAAV